MGTLPATCDPLSCARVNGAVRVMPVPETCAPAACAYVSGAVKVIEHFGDGPRLIIDFVDH